MNLFGINRYLIIITLLTAFVFCGCSQSQDNGPLANVEYALNKDVQEALDTFMSISRESLTDAQKHYYDFLCVKVNDKNYIMHESDSLIIKVLEYESHHQENGRYPEALYYAGRVYSDLGDFPRALSYFQEALDAISTDQKNLNLRGRIESQQGQLLNKMGLYEESIPHIDVSLSISRTTMDTINIMHNLQLLGWTQMKIGKYGNALKSFKEALSLAGNRYKHHAAKSRMYLALIKYKLHQTDSAIFYIKNTVNEIHPSIRNYALSIAADIYLEAETTDSAYKYACELISINDSIAKEAGYNLLLDTKLSNYIAADTLWTYINNYHKLLNARFNKNSISYALNQQNMYNYQKLVQEKEAYEKKNKTLKTISMWLLMLLMVLISVIFYIKNRNKTKIIELQQALANVNELKTEIERYNSKKIPINAPSTESIKAGDKEYFNKSIEKNKQISLTKKDLRKRLQQELLQIYEDFAEEVEVSQQILQSDIYNLFKKKAENDELVIDSDSNWLVLEQIILETSPQFKYNLSLLSSGKLTVAEIHTALLIKCGFRPVEMKTILGKSNGAIISRRDSICLKVLDKKMGAKVITGIIRLL